ncbi:hypothetical protein NPX13_g2222 [Xylaria arbuscula]|uniref:Uncharacterized protein n=1 Tax=Xylaria arbuscula TaxID=114810 RepID=A0A9W8NJL2_9PEZI|nr:hypothetical protein NPX13_g2222 [Xylaria arbuscula]
MSILCCYRSHTSAEKETQTEPIKLPIQPPRARLSKTLSRSDTDMYLSSILTSRGPSQLIIPAYHNIVDPEVVDVEDSDDEGPARDTRGPNMTALGSFRTRFIRRLSNRADPKVSSRPSVGNSDEELARRAELKRLMHKRIQEELKSEEEDEDDDLGLSPLKPPSISNCVEPELPGGGPRDTIEFSVSAVDDKGPGKEVPTPSEASFPTTSIFTGPQEPYQLRTHHSKSPTASIENPYQAYTVPLNSKTHVAQPPSSPQLTPVHLLGGNGPESPSTASWRLSCSDIHIESYIEPLVEARATSRPQSLLLNQALPNSHNGVSQQCETGTATVINDPTMQNGVMNITQTMQCITGTDAEDNSEDKDISSDSFGTTDGRYSPLDVWLRSQDVHYASVSSSFSDVDRGSQSAIYSINGERHSEQQCPEVSAGLSVCTQKTTQSSSVAQDNPPGAWPISPSRITSDESSTSNKTSIQMENAIYTEASPTDDHFQDVSSRYTSSRYTTQPNSQQGTPVDSNYSSTEIVGNRKILQPLSSAHGFVGQYYITNSENSDSSYRTALNKMPSSIHAKPEVVQSGTNEALSINASETASFQQREEELRSIKKRFGLTPARRYRTTPVRSKFREEFEDSKDSSVGRSSIFSKFYHALPKKSRVPSSQMELSKSKEEIGIYLVDCRKPQEPQISGPGRDEEQCIPGPQDGAASVWQCARNQEAGHGSGSSKARLMNASARKPNMGGSEAQIIPLKNQNLNSIAKADAHRTAKGKLRYAFSTPGGINAMSDTGTGGTVGIQAGVLQEWVEQLQAEDVQRQNRAESKTSVPKRQPFRLRTPPASWAKWPSYTRHERTAAAGTKDRVSARDFAVIMSSNISETAAEKRECPTGRDQNETPKNLSSQLSKALKSSWRKIIHTDATGHSSGHGFTTQGARVSSGFLEYPELKLHPTAGGYREVQALDQQIDTMKRRSTSGRQCMRQSSNDGSRSPLASRIAGEVHKFQDERGSIPWTDVQYAAEFSRSTEFLSPSRAISRRSGPRDPEPLSSVGLQCAYEDCVQTQMLEDGDSNITEGQDKAIKRAKSTGNIKIGQPENERTLTPMQKAMKMSLRRHKSLGWIRGRNGGSDKPTAEESD